MAELKKAKPLEDYCTNCGACCHAGVNINKGVQKLRVLVHDLPCKHMVWKGSQSTCAVYADRHHKAPWCADLPEMLEKGLVPRDCPYVENLEGYTPTLVLEDTLYKSITPALKLAIAHSTDQHGSEPFNSFDLRDFLKS
jgi:uncharacterized cysteine cluster protein YcgN (CxxCxxCC family)